MALKIEKKENRPVEAAMTMMTKLMNIKTICGTIWGPWIMFFVVCANQDHHSTDEAYDTLAAAGKYIGQVEIVHAAFVSSTTPLSRESRSRSTSQFRNLATFKK